VWQNQTIAYAYDTNGNILTRKTYSYTTVDDISNLTPTQTYTYQYTDSNNPDKLTSFDGNVITYDTNGNLYTYNGWTYTWNGKNLNSATNASSNVSYQYINGIRSSKTVNGVTTNYAVDSNNNITQETKGTDTINYGYECAKQSLAISVGEIPTWEKASHHPITVGLQACW